MKNRIFILALMFLFAFQSFVIAEVRTFVKDYTYQASEDDSRNSSRVTAMREVKRLLLEELGTYLESITEIKNFQLTKDKISSLTAGIVKTEIVNEKWDGHTYWIKTKIVADSDDVIKSIDNLRKDRDESKRLEELKKRSDTILEENKRLREELKLAKGEEKQKQKAIYEKKIKELAATEWFENGLRNQRKSDYKKALHDYSKAIELNPIYAKAYNNRGTTYGRLGNYNEAINDFSKAIQLNPKDIIALCNRGRAYGNLGKYNEEIIDYSKAIELDPTYAEAYDNRGTVYISLGKYREAVVDYSKVIELNPKDAEAYYYRGITYNLLGNYNEAINDFSKAIQLNPKDAKAYSSRGIHHGRLGSYNEAVNDFSKAIQLNPKDAEAYYYRAAVYSTTKNSNKAIQDLFNAIKINPDYRYKAKSDPFFDSIKSDPNFVRLIVEPQSAKGRNKLNKGESLERANRPSLSSSRQTARDNRFIVYKNGTVLDTRKNLMWAAKDNGYDLNWANAKSYCETYRGGGYRDWRMPTQDELKSLYDANNSRPIASRQNDNIHVATTLIDISSSWLWASETIGSDAADFNFQNGLRIWHLRAYDHNAGRALPVRFANTNHGTHRQAKKGVTIVKTEHPSQPIVRETDRVGRFIAYDNGTIIDTQTNLMWAAEGNREYGITWRNAKSYCDDYQGAGYTDWRLPTKNELMVVYNTEESDCKRYPQSCKWPWTYDPNEQGDQLCFYFDDGELTERNPDYNYYPDTYCHRRALPVRSTK